LQEDKNNMLPAATGMSVVQKDRASLMSQSFNMCRVLLPPLRHMGKDHEISFASKLVTMAGRLVRMAWG